MQEHKKGTDPTCPIVKEKSYYDILCCHQLSEAQQSGEVNTLMEDI